MFGGTLARICATRSMTRSAVPITQSRWASNSSLKVAVVGSGPAGFYLSQYLLKNPNVQIDIYEKFPVPFGLVRFGVAPDHPEVKNVINSFTTTATNDRVSFYGNISIGTDLKLQDLRDAYNAVVLCYGSAKDRPLNIEGEWSANVHPARKFVGWYNGIPEDKDLSINLNHKNVVIIGHGNVALDCARILLSPVNNGLTKTDITKHALRALQESQVQNVYLLGRRGPMQVAFTIKELRELTKIPNTSVLLDTTDVSYLTSDILNQLPRPRKRLTELLVKIANDAPATPSAVNKNCIIKFLRSPVRIEANNEILKTTLAINQYVDDNEKLNGSARVRSTNQLEVIESGLVIKSIGYMTIAIDDSIPIDDKNGTIRNVGGRVTECGPGLYCSGWAATGPSGVLLTTMNVSFEIAKTILDDFEKRSVDTSERGGSGQIKRLLDRKQVKYVSFSDWKNIDDLERSIGQQQGKPREKLVDVKDLLEAAKS